ncbi:MAG: metallophosphoesterase [Phocaeicola sp.]
MRIQYASDLHLEFRENTDYLAKHPLTVAGDILILAGDIHVFRGKAWEKHPFFDWCAENYTETYIIPGNHEYYDGIELSTCFDDYEYLLRENVRYINNRSIVIDDAEFFFTTLWSKITPSEIVPVQMGLTDCRRIIYQGAGFTSHDYASLHQVCIDWLEKALAKSTAKCKIVVTHHQPTTRITDPRFTSSTINSAFAVPMDDFIEQCGIDYWIYGHTHYNGGAGTVIGETTLLCNQLGYVRHGENNSFKSDLFFRV